MILDKACFAHYAASSDSKDLAKRTISDRVLKDKIAYKRAHEIAVNPQYDGYQRSLASMMYMLYDRKTGSRANVNELRITQTSY